MMEDKIDGNKPMAGKMSAGLLSVPMSALSMEGEDGAAIEPAVGDEVEVSVKGLVEKSEGGKLMVKPVSFNGVESEVESPAGEVEGMAEEPSLEEKIGAYKASVGGKMGEEVI